jgi:hypothetical protein
MTLEEAIKTYTSNAEYERIHGNLQGCLDFRQLAEWLRDYKRLKEQQPCEDAISRQAAIDAFGDVHPLDYNAQAYLSKIKELPPVSVAEKTGRWEWVQYDGNPNIGNWHCSECNRIVCGAITAKSPVYTYKYCPNCGAKMKVEE